MQGSINFDGSLVGNITGGGGGGGSEVVITPVLTSGTKIADVTVDGVDYDIYSTDYSGDISSLQTGLSTANSNITALQGRMTTAEGNITTLQSDMTAAESIIGDGQLDIGNDLTDAVNEINQSLSQLDGLAVYRQVIPTGDTASFIANDSMSIIKVAANIEPQQNLHGYDSPWVGGAGKNKLKYPYYGSSTTINEVTFTVNDDGTVKVNGTATADASFYLSYTGSDMVLPQGKYTLNGCPSGGSNTTYMLNITNISTQDTGSGANFTSDGTISLNIRIIVRANTTASNLLFKPMIRLASVTDATFAPYSNICPISGFTDIDVSLSPTLDQQDATIYTTNFIDSGSPLTVYGGYIDVISGALTVTDANIANYAGESLPSTWISDRDVYTSGGTPTTGAQVVYKLASALSYQLTAQQINVLVGQNYIWADTGSIKEVGYLDILHLS